MAVGSGVCVAGHGSQKRCRQALRQRPAPLGLQGAAAALPIRGQAAPHGRRARRRSLEGVRPDLSSLTHNYMATEGA